MKRMLLALMLPALLLTACGSSPEDKAVETMEEMANIISGVDDMDSAKAAGEKIKALAESMKEVGKELEKKYEGKTMEESLSKDQAERMKKATSKISESMMKLVSKPEVMKELGKTLSTLEDIMK